MVSALETFRGRDIASLRVVEPLALQMPATRFEELVTTARKRPSENDVGLLVHLLKVEAAEQRASRAAETAASFIEVETISERRRRDPEAFLRRLLAWPLQAGPEHVEAFLVDYVRDETERERLAVIADELRVESARQMFERWIREVSSEIEPEHVRQEIDGWCDEQGLDHVERSMLQELAEEARERPQLGAVEEAA